MTTHSAMRPLAAMLAVTLIACTPSKKEPAGRPASGAVQPSAAAASVPTASAASTQSAPPQTASARPEPPPLDLAAYPWHADESVDALPVHDDLLRRFEAPDGFERVEVEAGSFGAWLRRLPLAAPGTPVLSYAGGTILPVGHANLAAVATLDVGKGDLQQCADAVMRLYGEWLWSKGRRDMSYRAASGTPMPYARWERGERVVARGQSIGWVPRAAASKDDHASFRKYMDAVFAWSNTVALARQAGPVELDDLRPGDFLILPGNPGHTVLVLDLVRDGDGRRRVLLGQSYMPAQSFHVLQPRRGQPWFEVEPAEGGIKTPFWPKPFPWSSLRRLDG